MQSHASSTLSANTLWCCKPTPAVYSISKPTLVVHDLQTHSGGTLSANPLLWYSVCKPTHAGGTLSPNPLRWYSIRKPTAMVYICKPTAVVLYLQTHSSGTLSEGPLQWYSDPLQWYSVCNPLQWYSICNPLRWYSIYKSTLVVLYICKPTPV